MADKRNPIGPIPLKGDYDENGALHVTKENWDEFSDQVQKALAPNAMTTSEFMTNLVEKLESSEEVSNGK